MLERTQRFLSPDDPWSLFGYFAVVAMAGIGNSSIEFPVASLLASGMLAIFWLVSGNVRAREAERHPNARVIL